MREENKCFKTKSQSARCSVLLVCLLGVRSAIVLSTVRFNNGGCAIQILRTWLSPNAGTWPCMQSLQKAIEDAIRGDEIVDRSIKMSWTGG